MTALSEALEAARRIVEAADHMANTSAANKAERSAARRRMAVAMSDEYGVIQVARALLSASRADDGWRPIEEAPKMEGTEFLLWARGAQHIGYWRIDKYDKAPCPYWHYSDVWGTTGCREMPPTLFRPLPSPPKE